MEDDIPRMFALVSHTSRAGTAFKHNFNLLSVQEYINWSTAGSGYQLMS